MAALAIPLVSMWGASAIAGAAGIAATSTFMGMTAAGWGWAIGSMAASYLLAPDSEGPRLTDLGAGGSSYGVPIPLCYGTTKTPGNVIWATDLIETKHTESAKGGPEYTSYTYSQHLAVMVCAGPVTGIRRIWANGKLILDASDTNTGATGQTGNIRIYVGDESQVADSLLEAQLGVGNVPAHRGYCYVVFDNLQLADYGNRTPSFEFEVVGDGALVRPAYDELFPESIFTFSGASTFYDPYANVIHWQDAWQIVNIFDVDRREWVGSYNLPYQTWRIWPGPGNIVYGWNNVYMYKIDFLTGDTLSVWTGSTSSIGAYRPNDGTFITPDGGTIYALDDALSAVKAIATFPGVLWQSLVIAGSYIVVYSAYSERIAVLDYANNVVLDYSTRAPNGSFTWGNVGTYDTTRNRVYFIDWATSPTVGIWVIDLNDMTVAYVAVAGVSGLFRPTYMASTDALIVGDAFVSSPRVNVLDPETLQSIDVFYNPSNKTGKIYEYTRSPDKGLLLDEGSSYSFNAGFVHINNRITVNQVPLSAIVADLCERAGLDPADYDVTELTEMVDGYKTT